LRIRRHAAIYHANINRRQSGVCGLTVLFVAAGLFIIGYRSGIGLLEKGARLGKRYVARAMVGPIISQFALARFRRMLGTFPGRRCRSWMFDVARKSSAIRSHGRRRNSHRTRAGRRPARSKLRLPGLVPKSTLEMISVAEESGRSTPNGAHRTVGEATSPALKTAVALADR